MITVSDLSKVFRVHRKDPGFWGSARSLIRREFEDKWALKGVSAAIEAGEIVGLIGANGAGKTTLVKILSGIIHPSGGDATVLGFKPWERKNEFRRQIGLLMGQKAQLWWDLPAADSFILLREIYRVDKNDFDRMLTTLSETLRVTKLLNTPVRRLSLGERMKMELIAVLLHRPRVVFLDEPTIGLDITSQKAIRKFLLEYSESYKPAMLITSHYMEDIEELCKRILIIREGALVYDGPLEEVRTSYATHKTVVVRLRESVEASVVSAKLLSLGLEEVKSEDEAVRVKTPRDKIPQTINALLQSFNLQDISVEEENIANIIEALMHAQGERNVA